MLVGCLQILNSQGDEVGIWNVCDKPISSYKAHFIPKTDKKLRQELSKSLKLFETPALFHLLVVVVFLVLKWRVAKCRTD